MARPIALFTGQWADLPFEERYRSYVEVFPAADAARISRANGIERTDLLSTALRAATSDDPLNRMLVVDAETR